MNAPPPEPQSSLEFRNALHEWDHVPSNLKFQGSGTAEPLLTIAITTFKRPFFLIEALESALDQNTELPYEIVVVDNDPESQCLEYVLEKRPDVRSRNFRYYVNPQNIGMYGNINRCVPLARGEWLSILHDDDFLRDNFIDAMFNELKRFTKVDGIVSREQIFDQRASSDDAADDTLRKMGARYLLELALQGPTGWGTFLGRLHHRLLSTATLHEWAWLGRSSRRIGAATLFLGPVLGNGSGFLFRTAAAKEAGGFYPEEFPASDLTFYARFAARYHLRQYRQPVCVYRVAQNESLRVETARQALVWIYRLQRDMAGVYVPKWFLRFSPVIMEHWRNLYRKHWRIEVPREELEQLLGLKLPDEDHPRMMWQMRLLLKGM